MTPNVSEAQGKAGQRPALRSMAWLGSFGPLLALVAMFAIFTALDTRFASPQSIQALLSSCAVPMVIAVGMTFVIMQGSIDLSVEGVMGAASLVFSLLVLNSRTGLDLGVWAIPAALGMGLAVGLISGLVVTRLRLPSFMVTLGIWSCGIGIAMLLAAGNPPLVKDMVLREFALGSTLGIPNYALVAFVVVAIAYVLQTRTRFGRYSYMIGASEELVRLSGIQADRYKIFAFMLCGMLAAMAGAMEAARVGVGSSDIGPGQMFAAITAVVVGGTSLAGGRGGVLHTVVGVLTLTVLANGMIYVGVSPYIQQAVQGAIVLVVVLVGTWHLRARMRVVK